MGWLPNVSVDAQPGDFIGHLTPPRLRLARRAGALRRARAGRPAVRRLPGSAWSCARCSSSRRWWRPRTLFVSSRPGEWLVQAATVTGGALARRRLLWLVAACALKKPLARLRGASAQYAVARLLGAVSALYGCGLLRLDRACWARRRGSPAPLAGRCFARHGAWRRWRCARGQTPAATTARLEELQSRIRRTFLFNTLNSAIALVREEPAKAETMLEDLAELFRQALADPGESGTLADEIALAERYLAIEQVRFGDRLRIRWDLDAAASSARLPPLLLQPLVENAIKHGVEPSPRARAAHPHRARAATGGG